MSIIQIQFQVENDREGTESDDEVDKSKDTYIGSRYIRGPRYRAYKTNSVRNKSFYSCSSNSIRKRAQYFAENGFFYKGYGSFLVCFFCGFELDAKDVNIDVYTSHKEAVPDCGYVQFQVENDREGAESDDEVDKSKDTYIGSSIRGPRYRAYKSNSVRTKSFCSCSSNSIRKRAQYFAENGFFYKGYGSFLVCFFCGFELDAKDENIDVYTSHKEAVPDCGFVHVQSIVATQIGETTRETTTPETSDVLSSKEYIEDSEEVVKSLRCKVCLDKQVGITFQPCGHLAACETCASRLTTCPVCRARILDRIKTYLP